MKKLLHERLKEWSDSGDSNAYKEFYNKYKQLYSNDVYFDYAYAFGKMAEEIEKYYLL